MDSIYAIAKRARPVFERLGWRYGFCFEREHIPTEQELVETIRYLYEQVVIAARDAEEPYEIEIAAGRFVLLCELREEDLYNHNVRVALVLGELPYPESGYVKVPEAAAA